MSHLDGAHHLTAFEVEQDGIKVRRQLFVEERTTHRNHFISRIASGLNFRVPPFFGTGCSLTMFRPSSLESQLQANVYVYRAT